MAGYGMYSRNPKGIIRKTIGIFPFHPIFSPVDSIKHRLGPPLSLNGCMYIYIYSLLPTPVHAGEALLVSVYIRLSSRLALFSIKGFPIDFLRNPFLSVNNFLLIS